VLNKDIKSKLATKQSEVRIIKGMPNILDGNNGDIIASKNADGVVMYIKVDGKWWKFANALPIAKRGEARRLSKGKLPKGIFSTIELSEKPKKMNELGNINGNITSKTGITGDTMIHLNCYAKSSNVTNWLFGNSGTPLLDTNSTTTSVGGTIAIGVGAYAMIGAIAPYNMKVESIASLWGDSQGLAGSGTQYLGIWTTPGGSTSATTNTGTGNKTYTLKYLKSNTGTISANTVNHCVDLKSTASFRLMAGDWIVLGIRNTAATGGDIFNAAITLYCKLV